MNKLVLIIGGNLGDRLHNLNEAKNLISKFIGKIDSFSNIYETRAWGFDSENFFLNQVLVLFTSLNPVEILENIHYIENKLGRIRSDKGYISRTIDVDILFYNNEIINTKELVIPHPHIQKRKFVLAPLCEVLPLYTHPQNGKNMNQLLMDCEDQSEVNIY